MDQHPNLGWRLVWDLLIHPTLDWYFSLWNCGARFYYTMFIKSDLIYNMDYMRILGTELSSVILSQTK